MKKQFLAAGVLCATLLALSAKSNDPVLMNVAGKDVPLSEFEYLYNKNNAQQVKPQTIDEYVDMFVNFKLKVADAEAAGLDTTTSFRDEYDKFRNELATPYLRDTAAEERQIEESYQHMLRNVIVSHIMLPMNQRAVADSLREVIVTGQTPFEQVAREYSMDTQSGRKGGLMGSVVPGRFPWYFEEASYNTPVGGISPVVNSGMGYHIIRVESSEPAKGEVHAAHILRTTRGTNDSVAARQQVIIDSLAQVLTNPEVDFSALATEFSQDPGSARNGGDLGWFPSGAMVQPFDSIAFALADGEISKPFKTAFGWHIIKRYEGRLPGSIDQYRAQIKESIERDPNRRDVAFNTFVTDVITKNNGKVNSATIDQVQKWAEQSAGVADSVFIARLAASEMPIIDLAGKSYSLAEMAPYIPSVFPEGAENIAAAIRNTATDYLATRAVDLATERLETDNADYRNLINEYRDGILLFDISNKKVWERAAADTTGLEDYFRANRDKYSWEKPKFKSIIFFANNDSVLNEAVKYAEQTFGADYDPAKVAGIMRERFGRDIKVERVIAAQGENAITDYLGFNGPKPETKKNRHWQSYAAFRGRVIDAPEESIDVRGAVVADYQNMLEKQWLDQLHKQYKVKINKKVLKQLTK